MISVLRSNFVISVLRSFDAFNAFYHFIHQQCCLLVTKDSHNPIFASQVFSRWRLSHSLPLANSWILIMKTPWFVMLLTTFPSTVLSVGQQRWSQASSSHRNFFVNIFFAIRFWRFPIPWVLLCEAPKCVMLSTTFSSTMLSVGHQKWSHSLSSRLTFFPWHICHSLFLATSRIGVYEALKPILLVTTFFIYIVLCCSTEMVTTIILELQLFLSYLFAVRF